MQILLQDTMLLDTLMLDINLVKIKHTQERSNETVILAVQEILNMATSYTYIYWFVNFYNSPISSIPSLSVTKARSNIT